MVHDRLFSSFFRETVTRLGLTLAPSRLLRRSLLGRLLVCRLLLLRVLFSLSLAIAGGVVGVLAALSGNVRTLVPATEEQGCDYSPDQSQERHERQDG